MQGHERPTFSSLANVFQLVYRDQEITFTESNIAGQPLLSVGERTFQGDQVMVETTRIGTIVTVVLAVVADGDTTLLSLVLPPVRLTGWEQVHVQALAIQSTVRGTIAGPPLGPGMRYAVEEIEGIATFIVS